MWSQASALWLNIQCLGHYQGKPGPNKGRLQAKTFLEAITTNLLMIQCATSPWLTDCRLSCWRNLRIADAAQGKNPRPPGSHAWADLKARAFVSHYILLPTEGTNSNDPDTWLLGFRIRFDFHFHTRFTTLPQNQHGENEYNWYRLWVQSWSFEDGSWFMANGIGKMAMATHSPCAISP